MSHDMRRSYDTLVLVVRQQLGEDSQSGSLYVFVGKRPTRAKVLWCDRNGYCLLYKASALRALRRSSGAGGYTRGAEHRERAARVAGRDPQGGEAASSRLTCALACI